MACSSTSSSSFYMNQLSYVKLLQLLMLLIKLKNTEVSCLGGMFFFLFVCARLILQERLFY